MAGVHLYLFILLYHIEHNIVDRVFGSRPPAMQIQLLLWCVSVSVSEERVLSYTTYVYITLRRAFDINIKTNCTESLLIVGRNAVFTLFHSK